jgi:fido (protein-threonine AMPylation protein)/predicted transcriptional regulator
MINREQLILNLLLVSDSLASSAIANELELPVRTVQRSITNLKDNDLVTQKGQGRSTEIMITTLGKFKTILSSDLTSEKRLENMYIKRFNEEIFEAFLSYDIFEFYRPQLELLKMKYNQKIKNTTPSIKKRELERLIVEFAWKSSQIEGNTYSLLETEELILNRLTDVNKHSQIETQMILNHKFALDFVFDKPDYFQSLTSAKIIELHRLITKDMNIIGGLRKSGVGITGSLFKPLDNYHSILEMMDKSCELINKKTPYEKAFLASLLISYIQPFEDGNKRTSRILSNAILYSYGLPMLSFRSVKVEDYKTAILAFYEFNSTQLYSKIFISQLEYFVENYF